METWREKFPASTLDPTVRVLPYLNGALLLGTSNLSLVNPLVLDPVHILDKVLVGASVTVCGRFGHIELHLHIWVGGYPGSEPSMQK